MNSVQRNVLGIVAAVAFVLGYVVRHKRAGVVEEKVWQTTWWQ